eukprot:2130913-Amphidinium_carterae.2
MALWDRTCPHMCTLRYGIFIFHLHLPGQLRHPLGTHVRACECDDPPRALAINIVILEVHSVHTVEVAFYSGRPKRPPCGHSMLKSAKVITSAASLLITLTHHPKRQKRATSVRAKQSQISVACCSGIPEDCGFALDILHSSLHRRHVDNLVCDAQLDKHGIQREKWIVCATDQTPEPSAFWSSLKLYGAEVGGVAFLLKNGFWPPPAAIAS